MSGLIEEPEVAEADRKSNKINYQDVYNELNSTIDNLNDGLQSRLQQNDQEFMIAYKVSFLSA